MNLEPIKICTQCKEEKPCSSFYKDKTQKSGLCAACIECRKSIHHEWYEQNKEQIHERDRIRYDRDKEQIRKRDRDRRSTDSEYRNHLNEQKRGYQSKHGEKWNQYSKQYYQDHKEEVNKRVRDRRRKNTTIRIIHNLRSRMSCALKRKQKESKTLSYLGCSLSAFRNHIEKQFRDNMSWDNYGPHWHVDHIIPCCKFDLSKEEQIKKCFHFTNLQPLLVHENLRKKKSTYEVENNNGLTQCSRLHEVLDAGSNPNQP